METYVIPFPCDWKKSYMYFNVFSSIHFCVFINYLHNFIINFEKVIPCESHYKVEKNNCENISHVLSYLRPFEKITLTNFKGFFFTPVSFFISIVKNDLARCMRIFMQHSPEVSHSENQSKKYKFPILFLFLR